jgi:hypothetical protein
MPLLKMGVQKRKAEDDYDSDTKEILDSPLPPRKRHAYQ